MIPRRDERTLSSHWIRTTLHHRMLPVTRVAVTHAIVPAVAGFREGLVKFVAGESPFTEAAGRSLNYTCGKRYARIAPIRETNNAWATDRTVAGIRRREGRYWPRWCGTWSHRASDTRSYRTYQLHRVSRSLCVSTAQRSPEFLGMICSGRSVLFFFFSGVFQRAISVTMSTYLMHFVRFVLARASARWSFSRKSSLGMHAGCLTFDREFRLFLRVTWTMVMMMMMLLSFNGYL